MFSSSPPTSAATLQLMGEVQEWKNPAFGFKFHSPETEQLFVTRNEAEGSG